MRKALIALFLFLGLLLTPGLRAQTPVTVQEPTPLPGVSPWPGPSPVPSPRGQPSPPPLPTPPEMPVSRTTQAEREKPLLPTPENPVPVEPYQPALPLATPTPRPVKLTRLNLIAEGAKAFNSNQIHAALADQLTAIEESGLSPALADDAAFFLGVFYRQHGYSQAEVTWTIASGSTLRLSIREGPLTQLGTIRFEGNAHLPAATLLDYVTGAIRERFPGRRRKNQVLPYIESDLNSGVGRLRGLYQSEGYLDAVVAPPQVTLSADKTRADVLIAIHEGQKYRFGKIAFEGDIIFYPEAELRKEMEVFTNKPFTPLAVTNLERKIVYFYKRRGYFTVEVHGQADPAQAVDGAVSVKFVVKAGEVYHFKGISQKGLKRLRSTFLENRFKPLEGKVYDPEEVEKRYRRLMSTGLFSNLRLTQTPLPGHEVGLDFQVEEAKAHEVGFSIGYAKIDGAILGARYTDRDLFGNGRPLTFDTEVAQKLLRGELAYSDPWILESDYTLRLRLYALNQDLDGYSKIETGFRPEISRKIGQHLELGAFVLTRLVNIKNADIAEADLGTTNYRTDSIGMSATYDTRDSVLNPRRGYVLNATGDYASTLFGSSLKFVRATYRGSYYLPVGRDSLLAFGVRGGAIAPLDGSAALPIDERFFNGGANSVRSFVDRTLGPKDVNGHPVGGETFTVANIEFVTPIRDNFDLALFADAGSTGRRLKSEVGQTGFAIGPGLRYRLPIGPIRFDYGWNPARQADQPTGAWHFSFGFAF
ncbi:MAG: outer membrane protein assembly factor BamA [Chthoniobacteraceae bacterium]